MRPHLGRGGVQGQRTWLVRRCRRSGARTGLEDDRRLPQLLTDHPRPAGARAVSAGLCVDVRVRVADGALLVLARPLPRDRPGQGGTALSAVLPLRAGRPLRDSGLPLAARLEGPSQRRLRRRQQAPTHKHPVAVRRQLGQGGGPARQHLADVPVFLPGVHGRAPVDPDGAEGGSPRRRRQRVAGIPQGDAAAPAHRRRAADDRVVCVQLQQLRQHLPADRWRAFDGRPIDCGGDGHPDQLHVQAGVRRRQGQRLRLGERRRDHHLLHRRDHFRGDVLADQGPGERAMTVVEQAVPRAETRRATPRRPKLGDTWWRHLVGILAVAFALFPVAYIVSASFNADNSLSGSSLIPRKVTLSNYTELFTNKKENARKTPTASSHYARWLANTVIVSAATSFFTVLLGAIAAYAFSRFRFRGRRMGMIALLLIQMFPALLAVVAIYLMLLHIGDVFSFIGLNTLTGLILINLGGVMGLNTWLLKGFFDTIPSALDESARIDGATPAQIFWGVVLPLAAPVLAVIALLSFVGVINEFVIASVVLQTSEKLTLPVGLFGYIGENYSEKWGPFAAGVLIAAVPVVALFMFLQRFIVSGLTQGSVKGCACSRRKRRSSASRTTTAPTSTSSSGQ